MRRRSSLTSTSRASRLPHTADAVWAVVASGRAGPQWYVGAAPFVVRGALDRLTGGAGRRWEPPGTSMLATGDHAGLWRVTEADHTHRRLVLTARAALLELTHRRLLRDLGS